MCTVVILRRPGHDWPLMVAANRDELADRPWSPPDRHWRDRPGVTGGLDRLGGGSWLGVNAHRVVAAVLNRVNTLGPAPGRRSRGELPLLALDHGRARLAAEAMTGIHAADYRPFNMLIADETEAFWVRHPHGSDTSAIQFGEVPSGLSMITAYDRNDLNSPRIRRFLPLFEAAPVPRPEVGDWSAWQAYLASRDHEVDAGPGGAMTVVTDTGFGTVSSSLVALPAPARTDLSFVWLFAAGRPGEAPFNPVKL